MAITQKTLFAENLDKYNTFVADTDPFSRYFKITELSDTFTGGKNAFLIQGSEQLVADTLIKIEIKDSQGNTIYYEPGEGIVSSSVAGESVVTEYYEGVSKVIAVHIYPDTAFGPATITILGELSDYYNDSNTLIPIPTDWQGTYNVKWQKQITVNPKLPNTTKIRFYKRPTASITETLSPIYTFVSGSRVESNIVSSFANITLSKLDTFAGDVKRIKVYRTSEGDISDYDMIQDILLESKELLTSYDLSGSAIGESGLMTSEVLEKLWSYPTLTAELTSSRIDNGVKLNGNGYFTYTSSLNLSENSVYEFGIDAFYSASTPSDMGIYVSGSNNGEVLVGTLNGITPTKNLEDSLFQFTLPLAEPTASLYLSQSQSEWHIGNISLRLTEDTAFSPSEISFVTSMPTVIGNETYNFKFEFYDVNNNYVPVLVTESALFTGGNNNIGGTLIFISSSASQSLAQLNAVSTSISGTATLYSSSANTTIVTLSGSVSGSIVTLSGSVSGSITTLSGSVSSSLTSLSSSVSSSNAMVLSSSFAQVKNLADGRYSGSFIGDTVIYSPTIGGQQGYIKDLFTVGDNTAGTINLDARTSTRKIYIGTGTYNNANTGVYLDSGGNFSLKDKLTWNGTTLTVSGTINANAGNFTGNITSTATISGGTISGGTITGGSINIGSGTFTVSSAGALTATSATITGNITATSGTFTGTVNANAGVFSGDITSTATISGGTISGGSITGGSINIGNGKFTVSNDGTLSATGANINGTITAQQGNIGGWGINSDGFAFNFTDTNGLPRGVKINSARGAVELSTGGQVSVDINSNPFLTDLNSGTTVASGFSLQVPMGVLSGDSTPRYGNTHGSGFTLTAGTTYQFLHSTGFLTTIAGNSNEYNFASWGVVISQNSTPTIENSPIIIQASGNRNSAGNIQILQVTGNFAAPTTGTYYIRPFVRISSYQTEYRDIGIFDPGSGRETFLEDWVPVDGNLNGDYWLYGVSISRSTQKTEIVGGGIQVVKDIDTYFKVDRNAGESQDFVKGSGANFRFEGINTGNANSFNVNNFQNIYIKAGGHQISMGGGDTYMGIYPKGGIRISPAAGTGNESGDSFVQLEPGTGNAAFIGGRSPGSPPAASQLILTGAGGPSDKRLKTEIEEVLESSLEKINELKIKSFKFKEYGRTGNGFGNKRIGVIAQEVLNTSMSYVVNQNWPEVDGDYNVDHFSVLGHAIKAIQELSVKVNELEAKISGSV